MIKFKCSQLVEDLLQCLYQEHNNNPINFKQFMNSIKRSLNRQREFEYIQKVFDKFDKLKLGYITAKDLV